MHTWQESNSEPFLSYLHLAGDRRTLRRRPLYPTELRVHALIYKVSSVLR